MPIQHRLIPDAQLHEPKGVVSAASSTLYHSNGAGSGTWKKVEASSLNGITTDGGVTGLVPVSNGSEGFSYKRLSSHGSLVITANTNAFSASAAVDSTLAATSDYSLFTGTGAPWSSENLFGITAGTDRLTVSVTGIYRVDLWANISQYPSNTAKIAVRYRVNGSTFSSRYPISKSNSGGDSGNLNGFGLVQLNAGDYLQLYVASTATGNLTLQSVNFTLSLERQL